MTPTCPPGSPPGCVACPTTEAPGPYFQKEFFHNGYIKSLKQLVHFYNTRDALCVRCHLWTLPAGND